MSPGEERCVACGGARGARHEARERMFGLPGSFAYFECARCGTLTLLHPPDDLAQYYPPHYYAHGAAYDDTKSMPECLAGMELSVTGPAWAELGQALEPESRAEILDQCTRRALAHYLGDLPPTMRILDVGAGTGAFVYWLRRVGYAEALGVDPHVGADVEHEGRPLVVRDELSSIDGEWDLITFNHSLEHVADPRRTLAQVQPRLAEGGRCLVRVPISSSHAWEHYGVDWVQLDAPRHSFVPSASGMRSLLEAAGLHVERVIYDSGVFQFLGSEAYQRGETLVSDQGRLADWAGGISADALMGLAGQAALLNLTERGDQAAFVVRATDAAEAPA